MPVRVVVGKGLANNEVEIKLRKEAEAKNININDVINYIKEIIDNN